MQSQCTYKLYKAISSDLQTLCTLVAMESLKSIPSLSWREIPCPLSEVLKEYKVPNLVRIEEGHYGKDDACSLEDGQVLMLHTLRKEQRFLGKDSVGTPIAIPKDCQTKLLVCPLSSYCKYDPIYVCDMPKFYPNIKYFRVIENTQNEGIDGCFKPGSTAQIEYIDAEHLLVKFRDVKEPLPFNCRITFEALLDYHVHTLESAVREFGLPIKVRFLTSGNKVESPSKEYEKPVSKLGKVTILQKSKLDVQVLATNLNADSLEFSESPVKCSLISKDCDLNVTVPEGLLDGDPVYLKMVDDLNKTFLERYNRTEWKNVNKCQYLDGPDGNTMPKITGFILEAKITDDTESEIYDDVGNQRAVTSGDYCQLKPSSEDLYLLPVDDHGAVNVYESINYDDIYDIVTSNEETPKSRAMIAPTSLKHGATNEHVNIPDKKRNLGKKARSVDNILLEADNEKPEKTKPSALMAGLDICGEKLLNFSTTMPRLTLKRGGDVSPASKDLGPNSEPSGETSGIKGSVKDHSRKIRLTNRSAVQLTSRGDDSFRKQDKRNLRKAMSLDSLSEPSREVTDRQDKNNNFYETMSSPTSRKGSIKPPIPDKRPVLQKLKSGEITTKNSTTKPDNDISRNKTKSLGTNSVNYQNMPKKNRSTQRSKLAESKITREPTKTKHENNPGPLRKDKSSEEEKADTPRDKLGAPRPASPAPKRPEDLSALSVTGVGRLLTNLNMQLYVDKFREEQIDGTILMTLDEAALSSLDLNAFHVTKLTRVIKGWRPNVKNDFIAFD